MKTTKTQIKKILRIVTLLILGVSTETYGQYEYYSVYSNTDYQFEGYNSYYDLLFKQKISTSPGSATFSQNPLPILMLKAKNRCVGINNFNPTHLLEIGQDNGIETVSMLKVHGGATFNNNAASVLNQTTQVSINTNKKVQNAALTVAGTTFIGSWDEIDTLEDVTATTDPDDVKGMNSDHYSDYNLWVTKGIVSEDFALTEKANWADYVFKEEYQLPLLSEVATFIKENKHLPGVASEKEVQEKGYTLHNMNVTFLEKIENLYLYSIQQEEKIKMQEEKIKMQEEKVISMEKDIALLKAALLKQ